LLSLLFFPLFTLNFKTLLSSAVSLQLIGVSQDHVRASSPSAILFMKGLSVGHDLTCS
jgi:hypothetical protein